EDEHHLLWRVLTVLFRNPILPEDILQGGRKGQIYPTPAKVIQPNQARANPAELWQSIDNRIRPARTYTVTIPLDTDIVSPPYELVERRQARVFGQHPSTPAMEGVEFNGRKRVRDEGLQISGLVTSLDDPKKVIPKAKVTLKETGTTYETDTE